VTGYRIYRNGLQIATTSTTLYTNTGLTAATVYTYIVAAYDAAGNVSAQSFAVSATTLKAPSSPSVADIIIDNGSSRTSYTGTWSASGASGSYGSMSVWSRDGAKYSWTFTPAVSGNYQVSAWWTVWPSRSASVPVDIARSGGTSRVYINQQQNGGRWNILGTYAFQAGVSYKVTITSQPGPSSTAADALKFVYVP
jgi:chitodextrinase